MKKVRTESEVAAGRAAQRRGMLIGAAAAVIGGVLVGLSGDFVALNCLLTAAAAVAGGRAAATAAVQAAPESEPAVRSAAGVTGGLWAALGFAAPFAGAALVRWATLDAAGVARRLAALTPGELAQMRQFNIQPGFEYFAAGEWSYVFGYLLLAGLLGWLGGLAGAASTRPRR